MAVFYFALILFIHPVHKWVSGAKNALCRWKVIEFVILEGYLPLSGLIILIEKRSSVTHLYPKIRN